ncbi:MAG TPA: hypothetical protein VGO50_13625 [Pyrinomonadaceae bacterium]|nr:hypothetical protein [Pyrinomonadaceae bacterium]
MPTTYTIKVINNSPNPQTFYIFQQPAIYSEGSKVYSNSIFSMPLSTQMQLSLSLPAQYYAGVQPQLEPVKLGQANLTPNASVPIDLCSTGNESDTTTMSVADGLTLSDAANGEGLEEGAFRIFTPVFTPSSAFSYNAGPALNVGGKIILSSFVTVSPDQIIDVQPVVRFYVSTGNYSATTVIDFETESARAALCDGTGGQTNFTATYNANGIWTVSDT